MVPPNGPSDSNHGDPAGHIHTSGRLTHLLSGCQDSPVVRRHHRQPLALGKTTALEAATPTGRRNAVLLPDDPRRCRDGRRPACCSSSRPWVTGVDGTSGVSGVYEAYERIERAMQVHFQPRCSSSTKAQYISRTCSWSALRDLYDRSSMGLALVGNPTLTRPVVGARPGATEQTFRSARAGAWGRKSHYLERATGNDIDAIIRHHGIDDEKLRSRCSRSSRVGRVGYTT